MINFDFILENRLKAGVFQIKQLISLCFVDFLDGIEIVFIAILLSVLKKEWNLSESQLMNLASVYFIGSAIGGFVCGYLPDYFGRKKTLVVSLVLTIIVMLLTVISETYEQMMVLRLVYGVLFGLQMPLSSIQISEVATREYRGRYMVALNVNYQLGKFYCTFLLFFFMEDYETGNWRGLVLWNTVPAAVCLVLCLAFLEESARFHLVKQQFMHAFSVMDRIGWMNNGPSYDSLNSAEKDGLVRSTQIKKSEHSWWKLFSREYYVITLMLWALCILLNMANSGMYILLPFLFQSEDKGFAYLLGIIVTQLLSYLIAFFIIDETRTGGRKGVFIICSLLTCIVSFILYETRQRFSFLLIIVIQCAFKIQWPAMSAVMNESYLTPERAMGVAFSNGVGKGVAGLVPYIVFPLFSIDPYLPFAAISAFGFLQLLLILFYPVNKTRKTLE